MQAIHKQLTKRDILVLDGLLIAMGTTNVLRMTQEELADQIGVERSKVSVAFKKFKKLDVIRKIQNSKYLVDPTLCGRVANDKYNRVKNLWKQGKDFTDPLS
jgi:DNA-binding MarR family transcriptional regulator